MTEQPSVQLRRSYLETPVFAFDIETDTSHYHWKNSLKRGLAYPADITHISFYAPGLDPLVLSATPQQNEYGYQEFNRDTLQFEEIWESCFIWNFTPEENDFIRAMFLRENYTAIAHNLVFDARQIFGKYQMTPPDSATFWDTQAIHRFGAWGQDFEDYEEDSDEGEDTEGVRESLSLFNLTAHWLPPEDQEWWASFKGERGNLTRLILDPKRREKLNISVADIDRYVAIDSIQAYRLYEWQREGISNDGFAAQYDEARKIQTDSMDRLLQYELDYTKLCVSMAACGVRANVPYLHDEMQKYVALWKENLAVLGLTLETERYARQRGWQQEYIFSRIQPPTDKRIIEDYKLLTKTGNWSFNKKALEYYMESFPDLIYFRYHMDLETKIGQIENFLRHAEYDGRIHFILSRLTITGRNSGSSPNTQNLMMKHKTFYPKDAPVTKPGTDAGYLVADEGKQLISLDCSNGENWFAAMYAMDDAMAMACAASDFHTVMASTVYFTDKWDGWDAEQRKGWRSIGKNITFGTAYGMGLGRLSRELKIDYAVAKEILDARDRKFWRITQAKNRSSGFATQNGYTILWTGRRVRIRKWQGQYKGYTAWNSLAQGGLGEMICRGMLEVHEYLKNYNSRIVTQVHDEIVLEIDPNEYTQIMVQLIEFLSTILPPLWNSRTIPECRWLFTLDHIENSHKWGYNPYQDYLLPLDHYVNRWGFHTYPQGASEAPTWINQWGYGELALQKELGHIEEIPEIIVEKPFEWLKLRDDLRSAYEMLVNPVYVEGRAFVFPENLQVLRELHHKQGNPTYAQILESLDLLTESLHEYEDWRNHP